MNKLPKCGDKLLTRDEFRAAVFERDGNRCVICKGLAQDAHHILERRLFDDGGYYLSNGASLCGPCHLAAERTTLTVEKIRLNAGIIAPALPAHFYPDECYDKWGNIVLPTGQRTRGELFLDESVQKVLAEGKVLGSFTDYVKYPRTLHLPWSPGATSDDRIHQDLAGFTGEVIVTEKMDGENTSLYRDYYHARSLDSQSRHPAQSWGRGHHAKMSYNIPTGWRICAENLYAKHSIEYRNLAGYLLVFSVWDHHNKCLSWDETVEWCQLLELPTVPVLYQGQWDENAIKAQRGFLRRNDESEGYVVRVARSFHFAEFRKVVGKYVRAEHVQTTHSWKRQELVPNKLRE